MLNLVSPPQNVCYKIIVFFLFFADDQIDKVDINEDPTESEFVGQMAALSSWGLESETISRQILKVAYPTILKKESCLIHDQISQICVESVCGVGLLINQVFVPNIILQRFIFREMVDHLYTFWTMIT